MKEINTNLSQENGRVQISSMLVYPVDQQTVDSTLSVGMMSMLTVAYIKRPDVQPTTFSKMSRIPRVIAFYDTGTLNILSN